MLLLLLPDSEAHATFHLHSRSPMTFSPFPHLTSSTFRGVTKHAKGR
jgi:hypothetical protein